jgi:taurine dioxygenase
MAIETRQLSPHLGLEVSGIDLNRELDPAAADALRAAWIASGVLLFRNCATPEAHLRLSRCFGVPEPSATMGLNSAANPYLMDLKYDPEVKDAPGTKMLVDGHERAGWLGWHWDQSFMPVIVRGAMLRMIEPACEAGETGFIDAILAYERLPESLRKRIEGLEVVYHFTPQMEKNRFGFPNNLVNLRNSDPAQQAFLERQDFPPVVHPLVIAQPETGRKVLKLSPMHAKYVLGMERSESDALLGQLADCLVDKRYAYFHRWSANEAIVWDNWRVVHCAAGVPFNVRRYAQRTTLIGDYGHGRYLDSALDRNRRTATLVD